MYFEYQKKICTVLQLTFPLLPFNMFCFLCTHSSFCGNGNCDIYFFYVFLTIVVDEMSGIRLIVLMLISCVNLFKHAYIITSQVIFNMLQCDASCNACSSFPVVMLC